MNPNNVYALIVGIERYPLDTDIPQLNGPARDAVKFLNWLVNKGVPAENIELFLSPLDGNVSDIEIALDGLGQGSSSYQRATRLSVMNGIKALRAKGGPDRLLHVFWAGHGFLTQVEGTTRRLFYTDTTFKEFRNLDLDSLLVALRTSERGGPVFSQQCVFIDACADSKGLGFYPTLEAEAVADKFMPTGLYGQSQQRALFAAAEYRVAINESVLGTGRFSQAVFEAIKDEPLLPNMDAVAQQVKASAAEDGSYKPVYWSYTVGGEDSDVIDRVEPSLGLESNDNKVLEPNAKKASPAEKLKEIPPSQLRTALVRAFPTKIRLEMMFNESLGAQLDTRLNFEISVSGDVNTIVYELLQWADNNEMTLELIQAAYAANPRKTELKSIVNSLGLEDE